MTAVIQAGVGVRGLAWGTGPARGQSRATGWAREETKANSLRGTFSRTHGKFQFYAVSLIEQAGTPDPAGVWVLGRAYRLETWHEDTGQRLGRSTQIQTGQR